jgi:hypothetical protein
MLITEWYREYRQRPSEVIDPFYELNDSQRDLIDLLFMKKHAQRIRDILAGKVTVSVSEGHEKSLPGPTDPYPKPRCDSESLMKKGSNFVRKLFQENRWK